MLFTDLGLSESILRAINEEGYTSPTPIQEKSIPAVLKGGDLLAAAQTGTGKTAAFALPILSRIDLSKKAPQALVLALALPQPMPLAAVAVAADLFMIKAGEHRHGVGSEHVEVGVRQEPPGAVLPDERAQPRRQVLPGDLTVDGLVDL